jgi:protein phosphatase
VDVEGPHDIQPGDCYLICSDGLSGQLSDHEIGAVVSTHTPAEACRFLVDLANLRGGPDNITVVVVRIGGSPELNGTVPKKSLSGRLRRETWNKLMGKSRFPWPLISLLAGTLGVAASIELSLYGLEAHLTFFAAAAAIAAGLVGLAIHYQKELQRHEKAAREAEGTARTEPRVHRRTQCRIDAVLVDKVTKALDALNQRAEERNWEADREDSSGHRRKANDALRRNDLPVAFHEMCLAIIPYTRALQKQRQKEEVFQPLWDKPR